ncbi:MAG: hypothetical protein AAF651_04690 [Cyanobacteria bacterium P01_C01_bin.73]
MMKTLFIRFLTLPYGLTLLSGICLLIMVTTYLPDSAVYPSTSAERNQFPEDDERRGAGTRWISMPAPEV